MDIGRRIRVLREAVGVSRSDVARRAGITQQAIYYIEHGRSLPRSETLAAIADGLGVPIEALTDAEVFEAVLVRITSGAGRNDVSVRIQRLRMAQGVSIQALARRVGIPPHRLRYIERGAPVRAEEAYVVAKALGVTSDALIGGGDDYERALRRWVRRRIREDYGIRAKVSTRDLLPP